MNNTPQGQDEEKVQGEDIINGEVKETIKNELTINPMLYSRGPLMNSAYNDTMCISRGPLVTNNPHPPIEGENVSPLPVPLALEKCRTNSFSNLNMQVSKNEDIKNNSQSRQSQSNTLWNALKIIAGGEFFLLQILQWVNTFIILKHDSGYIGWSLLVFGLFPILVGVVVAVNEAQHYDYYLHLFPRKRAGVIFSIFSLFNLESSYSLSCYSNRNDLMIFNKNYKLKKRINLILNSFIASLLTSLYLFQNSDSEPYLITKNKTFENFFIAYIFISVTDIAFHLAFFSTDFFEDTIALLFQLFGICCFCNSQDEEDDDDEDYEEASLAKFDQTPLSDHTIAFRQISLNAKTFIQFVADNLLFSLSFYFSFMDLSLRIFLFAITFQSSLFADPQIYLIEGGTIGCILIAVIFIGVINCFCDVSNSYFEKSMVIVVSCFECAVVKLSRWSVHRIFEGMTQRQLFILKFVPGLVRLIELVYIHYILWQESDFSIDSYFFTDYTLQIYINYVSVIYCVILGVEIVYELAAVLFVYKSEEIVQQNEDIQGQQPDQQYSGDQRRIPMSLPSLLHKRKTTSLNKNLSYNPQQKKKDTQILSQSFQTPSHKPRNQTKQIPQAHLSIISLQDQPFDKYPLSNQSPVKTIRDVIEQENIEKDKDQTIADERDPPKMYNTSPLINQNIQLQIQHNESEPQRRINKDNIQINNNNSMNYHQNELHRTHEEEIKNQTQIADIERHKLQKQVTINISESRDPEGTFQKNEQRSQQELFAVSEGNGNNFPNKSPDMSLSSTQLHAVQPEEALNQLSLKHYGSQEEDTANVSPSLHQSRFAPYKQSIVTAVDPAHAIKTKETLSPVKSNRSIEGHPYQGGTIKISGAPARKVSDLISRFSSITNQRRRKSQQQIEQNGEGDSTSQSPKKSFSNKREPHKQGTSIARMKEQLRENNSFDV